MDDSEKRALEDIEAYGCHVIYVMEEDELPPFAYSVGITRSTGASEVVVVGFKQPLSHFIVNEYCRRVQSGEYFSAGKRYGGFVEGFDVEVRAVHTDHYREYFGWNRWLYKGDGFNVVQIVLPDTQGNWPWEEKASEWFRKRQPLLENPLSN